ncbi:MAG TPA: phosphatidylglycerophosphatase A [Candidatus Sulfopaludibacter sp.]|jgi:phosphatidylglycerophosphatase A|nr:phosphatidylglycerophosphatase A [Candidatus Sulfopaludibacter sp.]
MTVKIANLISTWFGCGRSPAAPGTAGSAAAMVIAIVLHEYAGFTHWHFLAMAALLFYPAVWAAGVTARAYKIKDPQFVVVDEVLGQWITLGGALSLNWKSYLAAFALFRLFDIWKPAPVRQLERLPGGLGINADDAMAGVYGAVVLLLASRLLQS